MRSYTLSHLADHVLLRDLAALVARDRSLTASLLAHLAEVDARKLYLPAAYPSMYHYCVGELRFSEDAAFRRVRAARTARQFPAIYAMLADGRLHLTTVLLLTPHLTPANASELLAAAAHQSRGEIEALLAARFPRPDVPCVLDPLEAPVANSRLALAPVVGVVNSQEPQRVAAAATSPAPRPVNAAPPAKLTPLAPGRYALQVTLAQATHDKLRYAQALLGHVVASGDVAQVLDRALDALIARLEQRRFAARSRSKPVRPRRSQPAPPARGASPAAAGARPGSPDALAASPDPHRAEADPPRAEADPRRASADPRAASLDPPRAEADPRHIPASVRRAVWQRDGGQCTFVSDLGRRCAARTRLEFDHVVPVARGGTATVGGLRLRCRAHNQYEAERVFGEGFMRGKRERVRRPRAEARSRAGAQANAATARTCGRPTAGEGDATRTRGTTPERCAPAPPNPDPTLDVAPWLRALGFRADEIRRAAGACEAIPGAPLEQRVRAAVRLLAPSGARRETFARPGSP